MFWRLLSSSSRRRVLCRSSRCPLPSFLWLLRLEILWLLHPSRVPVPSVGRRVARQGGPRAGTTIAVEWSSEFASPPQWTQGPGLRHSRRRQPPQASFSCATAAEELAPPLPYRSPGAKLELPHAAAAAKVNLTAATSDRGLWERRPTRAVRWWDVGGRFLGGRRPISSTGTDEREVVWPHGRSPRVRPTQPTDARQRSAGATRRPRTRQALDGLQNF